MFARTGKFVRRVAAERATRLVWPWAAFLAMLAWAWRVGDLFHNVPAYGDALEVLWGLGWYAHNLAQWHNPLFFSGVFAPQGWQVASLAHGPLFFVALLPFYALGGAAFAFNITGLAANAVAFASLYKLARLWLRPFASTMAALAYTFWEYRWFRTEGHLHTLVSTALLPLMVWAWEQARRHPAQRSRWFFISGVIWAASITASLYALWHGLLLLLAWALAQVMARQMGPREAAKGFVTLAVTAMILSGPTLWLFWRAESTSLVHFYAVNYLVGWSASLNSFAIPSLFHPFLKGIARTLDQGPLDESEVANFGLVAGLTALCGMIAFRKDRRVWPWLACSAGGLLFALGPVLKWNGNVQTSSVFWYVDQVIWSAGHGLKAALFPSDQVSAGLATAIPLPGMLAAALVPFWEAARVSSRFAFVAAVGLFPLMGSAFDRIKPVWARAGLAAVLVFELLPPPTGSVPALPASHPAFEWLKTQDLGGDNIIDLASAQPGQLTLLLSGAALFATQYHQQATVAGVGSYMPAHFAFLSDWFNSIGHPLLNHDLTVIMRAYHVRYLVVYMQGGPERQLLNDAKANSELGVAQCFDPPRSVTPWNYRICIIAVLPARNPRFNVIEQEGWSRDEPWGTWIEGRQGTARWVATSGSEQYLDIALQPECLPGRPQHVQVLVNDALVAEHLWDSCAAWQAHITLPASVMQVGWNVLSIQANVSGQPIDPASGQIVDTRSLSVAATQLVVGP